MATSALPGVRSGASPQRVLALGGALTVTAIALAGSLGFGPGAAASADPAPRAVGRSAVVDPPPGSTVSATSHSDGWLTIDKSVPGSKDSSPGSHLDGRSPAETAALPASSGSGRRVVYDISAQRVWLVGADGSVERTYLVSGARREDVLDPGTYAVYSRSRHAVSLNHAETMEYMVRFAHGDHAAIGFHDIPVFVGDGSLAQSRGDLGTPQSAGCIRQWESDARALWSFAGLETSVVVVA